LIVVAGLSVVSSATSARGQVSALPRSDHETGLAATFVRTIASAPDDEAVHALVFLQALLNNIGSSSIDVQDIKASLEDSHAIETLEEFEKRAPRRARERTCEVLEGLKVWLGWDGRLHPSPIEVLPDAVTVPPAGRWFSAGTGFTSSALQVRVSSGGPGDLLVVDARGQVLQRSLGASKNAFLEPAPSGSLVRVVPSATAGWDQVAIKRAQGACDSPPRDQSVSQAGAVIISGKDAALKVSFRWLEVLQERNREAAPVMTHDGIYRARISGDIWFQLKRQRNELLRIETSDLGQLCDTVLDVYQSKDAKPFASDDDSGEELLASRLEWPAIANTPYYVRIRESEDRACSASVTIATTPVEGEILEAAPDNPSPEIPARLLPGSTYLIYGKEVAAAARFKALDERVYRIESDRDVAVSSSPGAAIPMLGAQDGTSSPMAEVTRWGSVGAGVFTVTSRGDRILRLRASDDGPLGLGLPRWPLGAKAQLVKLTEGGTRELLEPTAEVSGLVDLPKGSGLTVEVFPIGSYEKQSPISIKLVARGRSADSAEVNRSRLVHFAAGSDEVLELRLSNEVATRAEFVLMVEREELVHNGLAVGDEVVLHRHQKIGGDANWNAAMEKYVGCLAKITTLRLKDGSGSWTARVDVDGGRFSWRTRSLARPTPTENGHSCSPSGKKE
jgi:hypothetical protein